MHDCIVKNCEKNERDHKYTVPNHRENRVRKTATLNLQDNFQTKEEEVKFVERLEGMISNKFRASIDKNIKKLGLTSPVLRWKSTQ